MAGVERGKELYQPPSAERIASALPDDTLLAMYALLDETLVIWLLGRDGLHQLPVQPAAKELRQLISEFRKAIARRSSGGWGCPFSPAQAKVEGI